MFKNILVPVDFSKQSLHALKAACKFGHHNKSSLTVLSVVDNTGYPGAPPNDHHSSIMESLEKFASDIPYFNADDVEYLVLSGIPGYVISELANKGSFDLIIMGTHSEHSPIQKLMGSVALKVIENSNIPVFVIPDTVDDLDVSKIAYAADFKEIKDHSTLDCLRDLALGYDSELHLVNVTENPELIDNFEDEAQILHTLFNDVNHAFFFSEESNLKIGLNNYIKEKGINVLAMMPRKHSFIKDLFHKSATEEVVLDLNVPLFSFHE